MLRRVGSLVVGLALVVAACSGDTADSSTAATGSATTGTSPAPTSTAATVAPDTTTSATTATGNMQAPADLVITGGPVLTMDPALGTVEAVAVTGETITAVGTAAEMAAYVSAATMTVDLDGQALLPGFVDPHTHLLSDAGQPILQAQGTALANGITSLADGSVESELLADYVAVAGELRVRVGLYLNRTDFCGEDQGTWYEAHPPGTTFGDRLFIAGVKIFTDGGACGLLAASDPFIEGVEVGEPFHSPELLNEMTQAAHDAGYQILLHAQGDLAIRDAQDAIAAALDGGANDRRHRIDHNSIATPDVLGRYAEIGIIPVLFGYFPTCADVPWTDSYREHGEDWRALLDANPDLPIAWHGDDPWLPPVSPLLDLASYVTRADIADDGSRCEPPAWLAENAITVEEGLAMMTRNAAFAIGRDHEVGSITPGKYADMIVVSSDPTSATSDELFDLEVIATYVAGVLEYCGAGAGDVCATDAADSGLTASASMSRSGHGPALALDGLAVGESFWSSGADAPQWLRVDFSGATPVERLRFVVFQNPSSDTVHELEILVGDDWRLVERFEGFTTTGDVLEWNAGAGESPIDAFRMTTLASLSWPEWFEVEVEVVE